MRAFARWGVAVILVAGCTGDDDAPTASGSLADVLVAVVETEARPPVDVTAPTESSASRAPLPVVYVTSPGEQKIDAGTQARVAETLRDEIDVRFADSREEAIDETLDGAPVRDEGVLVAVPEWPEEISGESVDLLVDVYRSVDDRQRRVMTVRLSDDRWAVASTSIVPTTTIPPATTTP